MTAVPKTPKEKIRENKVKFAHSLVKSVHKDKQQPNKNNSAYLDLEKFDFKYIKNKECIEDYIKRLDDEVQRCLQLQKEECEDDKLNMQRNYRKEMAKIPKIVKNMTIKQYNTDYKKNVMEECSSVVNNSSSSNNNLCFGEKAQAYQTPLRVKKEGNSATTKIKTVKRNQRIYDSHGSLVQLCNEGEMTATCRKKEGGAQRSDDNNDDEEEINFEINVGNGELVAIESVNDLDNLDEKYRALAIEKFQKYQEKVNFILGSIAAKGN